ncbi:MAG: fatty acid desaturase [Myxococcota bacterium]
MAAPQTAFARELADLQKRHLTTPGPEDVAHFRKMQRWTRGLSVLGYATAWIAPNPISILAISTGRFARWTMLSHHVGHGGYDRVPNKPEYWSGKVWAHGARRFVDWLDWMPMAAWQHEHNKMHHYRLGEVDDPDLVEVSAAFIRNAKVPLFLKYILSFVAAMTWKPLYYAPTTLRSVAHAETKGTDAEVPVRGNYWSDWFPFSRVGREVWLKSWIPYIGVYYILFPALFLLIGPWAAMSVLINTLLAELVTNLHAFFVVAPNHTGDDLYRFSGPARGKDEFHLRQIVGSANYACGNDVTDFLHGWLNYQIEHHLFPRATMLQYRRMQPELKTLCHKYGVPYVQESVWKRAWKTVDIMTGQTSMRQDYEYEEAAELSRAAG